MKFSCTKDNLYQALSLSSGVAGKNANLPILGNVLIRVSGQKIEFMTTNLELAVIFSLRGKAEKEGAFTVPARTLAEYVNLLSDEKVDIELQENELLVKCGRSTTKIKGAPDEEFPIIPAVEGGRGFLIDAKELKAALAQVMPAVAKSDIRPELSGVFFGFNVDNYKGLVLAATDSYRLAEKKIGIAQGQEELKIIVPGRTAQEMARILSLAEPAADGERSARMLVGENQIALHYNGVQMTSRLVDGQYPDYTQIIPKEFKTTAEFDAAGLAKEIKAAALFTTTGVNAVSIDLNSAQGSIGISSTSTQTGEYASEIGAEIQGEENSVLLNHRYVLDGLSNLGAETAVMKVVGADSPCVLLPKGDESFLYIVMPVRQ